MGKDISLFQRLRNVRIAYERENYDKKNGYAKQLDDVASKIKEIKARDYVTPYKKRYAQLLEAANKAHEQIKAIEKSTHGLKFTTADYLSAVEPISIDRGKVEEVFADVAEQLSLVVDKLSERMAVDEYKPHLQLFCKLLATVKYINAHADKLLSESGLPEGERDADLAEFLAEQKAIKDKQKTALLLENLDCYDELVDVADSIRVAARRFDEDRLGSGKFEFDTDYRYLIGFWKEKVPAEDVKFAEQVMGLKAAELSSQAIYFEPEKGRKNIIINARSKDFTSKTYTDLLRNIYLSIASRLPKNCLQFTYISTDPSSRVYFGKLYNTISTKLGVKDDKKEGNYTYRDCVEDTYRASEMIQTINKDFIESYSAIEREGNIYQYNRNAEFSRKPFHLIYIDKYPECFTANSGADRSLKELLTHIYGQKSGYMVVLSQCVDAPKTDDRNPMPLFQGGEENRAMVIDITNPDHVTVDGREADLDITTKSFNEHDYWEQLNKYYTRKDSFMLTRLLKAVDDLDGGKVPSVFQTGKLRIPLGFSGQQIYELPLEVRDSNHMFIVGGSGYGKTSFVHTFILSTAYRYSPKEVQFYLADWKESEFAFYKPWTEAEKKGVVVKSLPHVRYLQDKSTIGDYVTFLKMVRRIVTERNNMFKDAGCSNITSYNALMREQGKDPLAYIFVIVDEYQSMFKSVGGEGKALKAWTGIAEEIMSIARSVGVALVLCAQEEEERISLANVNYRVVLGTDDGPDSMVRKNLYGGNTSGVDPNRIKEDVDYLSVKKEGRALIGRSADKNPVRIRSAYAGEHPEKAPITVDIVAKHKCKMPPHVLGGSEGLFNVDNETHPSYDHMNELMLKPGMKFDPDDDFAIDPYDREAFPLYVGVSTADAYPTELALSMNENSMGYFVYTAMEGRRQRILNKVMLSYLYKTAMQSYSYDSERIYYVGRKDWYQVDIGANIAQNPFLKPHVRFCDVKNNLGEVAEQLIKLNELRKQREAEDLRPGSFEPILLVIHSLEWLITDLDENLSKWTAKQSQASAKPRVEKPKSSVQLDEREVLSMMEELRAFYAEEKIDIDEVALRAEAIAQITNDAGHVEVTHEEIQEVKQFRASQVIKAVSELFTAGNRKGIFVVVASGKRDELSAFRKDILNAGYGKEFTNVVYGCYDECLNGLDGGKDNDTEPNTICYVSPGEVKTRLYNFKQENNPTWWKTLKNNL